jgi:hypothetical protein
MIVEIGKCRVNFFRLQIRMLSQQLFCRPTMLVVFRGKMDDLIAASANPSRSVGIERKMRIMRLCTHRSALISTLNSFILSAKQ